MVHVIPITNIKVYNIKYKFINLVHNGTTQNFIGIVVGTN